MKSYKEYLRDAALDASLSESSLSRVHRQSLKLDSGAITAARGVYSKAENKQRNTSLKLKLLYLSYGITAVKGYYIECYDADKIAGHGGKPWKKTDKDYVEGLPLEVREESFLVVDLRDTGTLEKNLIMLGKEFDQDSILFIEIGGVKGRVIGTNNAPFPGLGMIHSLKNPVFGVSGTMYTRVNGRPFILTEEGSCSGNPPENLMARGILSSMAKVPWESIPEDY